MASGKFRQRIDADAATARGAGITGTPTFIIGPGRDGRVAGRKVVGSQPFATFEKLIDEALAANVRSPKGAGRSRLDSDTPEMTSGDYRLEMRRVQ
jgi:predicted DsbA family dithiol-disulfide isomerase